MARVRQRRRHRRRDGKGACARGEGLEGGHRSARLRLAEHHHRPDRRGTRPMESGTELLRAARGERAEAVFDTPVGPLVARAGDDGISELLFTRRGLRPREAAGDPCAREHIRTIQAQLGEYFDGKRKTFEVPLRPQGPPFHMRVWNALLDIPYGETISYGELARRVGDPTAARAVGTANGANPIVIVIPCHRVIGADGKLVGYGGGLWRKRALLDLETGRLTLAHMS